MTSTSESRATAWLSRPAIRILAAFAIVIGPAAAVPLLVIGSASADTDPGGNCYDGAAVVERSFDGATGTATVVLAADPTKPACNTVSLLAYQTTSPVGPDRAKYPQQLVTYQTAEVTSTTVPVTLTVGASSCISQLDLIYGDEARGTIQQTLNGPFYSGLGVLIDHRDYPTAPACTPVTPPTSSPTTTPPTPPPTSSSSSAPPTSPTTPSSPSSSTTIPPTTPPPTSPPVTTTTSPVTTTTPSTSMPPVYSTTVVPSSTSTAPTSTSPVFSTSVLPFSTSRPPATPPGALPFTGANAPTRTGVLVALGLISGGGALVLFAGRTRRRAGGHRVG